MEAERVDLLPKLLKRAANSLISLCVPSDAFAMTRVDLFDLEKQLE